MFSGAMQTVLDEKAVPPLTLRADEVREDIIANTENFLWRRDMAHQLVQPCEAETVNGRMRLTPIDNLTAHIFIVFRELAAAPNDFIS